MPYDLGDTQQSPTECQVFVAVAIRKDAVVANAHEASRQHMHEETSQELGAFQAHDFRLALVGIIFVVEGDSLVVHVNKALIRDGDSMRVASQIFQDLLGTAEGAFGVNHPVLADRLIEQLFERSGVRERLEMAEELELARLIEGLQPRHEFATKHSAEDTHGKKKLFAASFATAAARHPAFSIKRQPTTGDDAV